MSLLPSRRGPPQPASHYVWRPGAPPARPPRAAWPRLAGVLAALVAQAALYLTLRHIAVATLPAWAHHHVRPGASAWPALVPVDLLHGTPSAPPPAVPGASAPIAVPPFMPAPVVLVAPPDLGPPGPGSQEGRP